MIADREAMSALFPDEAALREVFLGVEVASWMHIPPPPPQQPRDLIDAIFPPARTEISRETIGGITVVSAACIPDGVAVLAQPRDVRLVEGEFRPARRITSIKVVL